MSFEIDFKNIKQNKKQNSDFVNKFRIIQALLDIEKEDSIFFDKQTVDKYQNTLNYLNKISDMKLKNTFLAEYLPKEQSPKNLELQKIHLWKYAVTIVALLAIVFFPIRYFYEKNPGKSYIVIEDFKKSLGIFSDQIAKEIPGQNQEADEMLDSSSPAPVPAASNQIVISQNQLTKTQTPTVVKAAPGNEVKAVEARGFLYRGKVQVVNLDVTSKKLAEILTQLGASKAGEVELGWTKGNMKYFHFTIPESKYSEVMKVFNTFGKLSLSKEAHPRVMPKEISRYIVEVTELNTAK
jgi:hypothetical protein